MTGNVSERDTKHEVDVVASIRKVGGHANIIDILDYGWLEGVGLVNTCFIDMELGDFTLTDYIKYHRDEGSPEIQFRTGVDGERDPALVLKFGLEFVRKGCSMPQKLQNMWTIGFHIAAGLEFMHIHNQVHRDIKPSNGMYPPPSSLDSDECSSPLLFSKQYLENYRFWTYC